MDDIRFSLLTKFKKSEIETLFKNASLFFRSPLFILLAAPAQLSYGRLLLVVSKKIGSAPERNKIRRRLKAIYYEHKLFRYNRDIVFIAKSKQLNILSFQELETVLIEQIKKL